jgi:UDP-N-acetyl-D-mannosaminuronic acid transferase (WecB/TagA/CpsF family)
MQDPKELTPADRERIAQAAQLLTLATGSGVAEGTIMKVINSNNPRIPDPIELMPMPWLLRYHWMQPRRIGRELFRRALED